MVVNFAVTKYKLNYRISITMVFFNKREQMKQKKKPYLYRFMRYNLKCLLLLFIPNEKGGNSILIMTLYEFNILDLNKKMEVINQQAIYLDNCFFISLDYKAIKEKRNLIYIVLKNIY